MSEGSLIVLTFVSLFAVCLLIAWVAQVRHKRQGMRDNDELEA